MADTFEKEIAYHQHEIIEELNKPWTADTAEAGGVGSVFWVIQVLSMFLNLINSIVGFFRARIAALEEDDDFSTSSKAPDTAARNNQLPSALPSKSRRCAKCHARGHAENDCKTTDPAAMRRRVASNQRRKKDARFFNPPLSLALPPPLPYHFQQQTPAFTQPQVNLAAMAADASELRRRQTQSARDKRRVRHSS